MKQDERMWDFIKTLTDTEGFIDMDVMKEKIKKTHVIKSYISQR